MMLLWLAAAAASAPSLEEDSIVRLLANRFRDPAVSYVLFEVRKARFAGGRWTGAGEPIPAGSLVKPFTALAWGETHGFRYPEIECREGCWRPSAHGRLGLEEAIAHSCNVWFDTLSKTVDPSALAAVCARFALPEPEPDASLTGRGGGWRIAPVALARAYCELANRRGEAGVARILEGMKRAGRAGTAAAAGGRALAKTGTAPCTHEPRAPGDGMAVLLFPAERPVWLLLVRLHSSSGASAAGVGARMLKALQERR